jgi:lincosamide nucleotidyltransferase A/C/D/E
MPEEHLEMTASDVIAIVQLLNRNDIEVIIDGGWGVDALLGEQTRTHEDLDVAVKHRHVPKIRALLEARDYQEIPRDDSWECNFVLGDGHGHQFDVHTCTFDDAGKNVFGVKYPLESWKGTGTINGFPVKCIILNWLVKFHTGYKLDEDDYHDVRLLCMKFGIEMPKEYDSFVKDNS